MGNQKVLVLGFFGYENNQIDGQTIKTREIFNLVNDKLDSTNVFYFDTQSLRSNKLLFLKLFVLLFKVNKILYLPGKNNLQSFFPVLSTVCKILKKDLIYIVVGGWLVEFLNSNRKFIEGLKRCKCILVETSFLKENLLKKYNISNVLLFPNFRQHNFVPKLSACDENNFKIVFMARIMLEKGIDYIFNFAKSIDDNDLANRISIDFYGQINKSDEQYFLSNVAKFRFMSYKGVVEPKAVFETVSHYDLLVLPTFYEGEGFPGTIIDSYIAGVPVLVSNWKQLPEFVEINKTGFLFNLDDQVQFNEKISFAIGNCTQINTMKINSYKKSRSYSAEMAWEIIKSNFDN